jgi:SET domain-containing protein
MEPLSQLGDVEVRPSGIEGLGLFARRAFAAGERIRSINVVRAARRAIVGGAEITCDYQINVTDGSRWPCRCGAPRCRGEVVGDFFALPAALPEEYRPHLADWFVRRHRERLSVGR